MGDVGLERARDAAEGDDQAETAPRVRQSRAGRLAELFRDHAEALRVYVASRFGPGPPEPEDVVQTAFAKVADAANFDEVRDLRAFLYATACNFAIDQRRRAARHALVHRDIRYLNEAGLSDSSSEDVLITKERLAIYQSALHRMPAMRRRIFLMVRVQGHSPAELATRFSISESAVNKHVGRALADCASALAKADGEKPALTSAIRPHKDQLRWEAGEQIAKAHAAGVRPEDDAALSRWRSQDPDHELAFAEISGVWDGLADLGRHPALTDMLGEPTLRERWVAWRRGAAAHPRLAPRRLALASLAAAVIGAALWFGGQALHRPDFETKVAQIREVPLADGSVITLGGRSSIDVRFDAKARRVKLAGGEAFFSVARNPDRPFIVEAGDTRIRVVGTKFNVNFADGQVRVSVLEGVVRVTHAANPIIRAMSAPTKPVQITAHQEAVDSRSQPGPVVKPAPVTTPGAWREGRFDYEDAPLSQVVADINRYRPAAVQVTSEAVGALRITTSFNTGQIEPMLLALPQSLPVEVRQRTDGTIEIGPS